jgi:hypothetical protein
MKRPAADAENLCKRRPMLRLNQEEDLYFVTRFTY